MRILTLGGKMLTDALRRHGHEVMHLGLPGTAGHPQDHETKLFHHPENVRTLLRDLAEAFRPDWILQVDDSTPLAHAGLEALPFRKAWYAVDSHLHMDWHRHFAPLFDVVFCAQQNRIPDLNVHRTQDFGAVWLPLACNDEPVFLPWEERTWDVSFVGTVDAALNPARVALLEGLRARGQDVHVTQGDHRPVYRASRIVLNQSVHDDLNLRCFESIGQGALLITDSLSHSLEDIGIPGTDFLVYPPGDAETLQGKIRWALGHPAEAEAIARAGQVKVMRAHTMAHRLDRLAEVLRSFRADGRLETQGNPAVTGHVLAHLAVAQEHLSRLSLPAPLTAFFAGEARRLSLAALAKSPDEPFALLTLARLDLERGAVAEALAWLERSGNGSGTGFGVGAGVGGKDGGGEYLRSYVTLLALLLAHNGRIAEARRTASAGLRDFPGDGDLQGLVKVLGPGGPQGGPGGPQSGPG